MCNQLEAEIAELEDEERSMFLSEMGGRAGLRPRIRAGYALLGLQTYFTAGVKEVRADRETGASAIEAAGVIHTDFQKGFIRAEVIAYDDYTRWAASKVPKITANGAGR